MSCTSLVDNCDKTAADVVLPACAQGLAQDPAAWP
jgi:hypothetical protein